MTNAKKGGNVHSNLDKLFKLLKKGACGMFNFNMNCGYNSSSRAYCEEAASSCAQFANCGNNRVIFAGIGVILMSVFVFSLLIQAAAIISAGIIIRGILVGLILADILALIIIRILVTQFKLPVSRPVSA